MGRATSWQDRSVRAEVDSGAGIRGPDHEASTCGTASPEEAVRALGCSPEVGEALADAEAPVQPTPPARAPRRRKPGTARAREAATALGIDLRRECPVCRSLDCRSCSEDDRSFVRRTRFESEVEAVARCPRCEAPLSILHVAPPDADGPPYRLPSFTAVHVCIMCHPDNVRAVALAFGGRSGGGRE